MDDSKGCLSSTWHYISLSVCSARLKRSIFFSIQVHQHRKRNIFSSPSTVWPLSLPITFKILSRLHRFSTWYSCVIRWLYVLRPNISYLAHTPNSAVFPISLPQTYIFCLCYRRKQIILLAYLGLCYFTCWQTAVPKLKKKKKKRHIVTTDSKAHHKYSAHQF